MNRITLSDDIVPRAEDYERHVTRPYNATPERKLWLSVLVLAIKDFEDDDVGAILEWIESDDFKFICNAVGCRPGRAAQHLREVYCG